MWGIEFQNLVLSNGAWMTPKLKPMYYGNSWVRQNKLNQSRAVMKTGQGVTFPLTRIEQRMPGKHILGRECFWSLLRSKATSSHLDCWQLSYWTWYLRDISDICCWKMISFALFMHLWFTASRSMSEKQDGWSEWKMKVCCSCIHCHAGSWQRKQDRHTDNTQYKKAAYVHISEQ